MTKTTRIQITPKGALLNIPPRLRKLFAEEAVKVIDEEGRIQEVVNRIIAGITGITQSGSTNDSIVTTPVKATKNKRQKPPIQVTKTDLEPAPEHDFYRTMLNETKSMPSIMLGLIKQAGNINWDELLEKLDLDHNLYDDDKSISSALEMLCAYGYVSVDGEGNSKRISAIQL